MPKRLNPESSDNSDLESVSTWIGKTRKGDPEAIAKLWARYYESLEDYARHKLPTHLKQMVDEEDIALSAFNAMLEGLTAGRFDEVRNRDDLWKILTVIAARKSYNQIRYETRKKRGGGRKRGNSAIIDQPVDGRIAKDPCPSDPAWLAEFADTCRMVFQALPDDRAREIAGMRLAGYSVGEIAQQLNLATRTIERKLNVIRTIWLTLNASDSPEQATPPADRDKNPPGPSA